MNISSSTNASIANNRQPFHVGMEFDKAMREYPMGKRYLPSTSTESSIDKSEKRRKLIKPSADTSLELQKQGGIGIVTRALKSVLSKQAAIRESIEKALGGIEKSNVERFEKEYGLPMSTIIEAAFRELASMSTSNRTNEVRGLHLAGIKKWKIAAFFNENRTIKELFIGRFHRLGATTKVYLSPTGKALLLSRKGENNCLQLLNSYANIRGLNNKYHEDANARTMIPLVPKLMMTADRSVLITEKTECAEDKFRFPPVNLKDFAKRLAYIREVISSLKLLHEFGLVHGDVKPSNMMIYKGKGQLHDLGGSRSISFLDNKVRAAGKFKSLSRTTRYNHYNDLSIKEHEDVDYPELGRAGDMFALGISTLEILNGMYDEKGIRHLLFPADNYCIVDENVYITGEVALSKSILNFEFIPIELRQELQDLISGALHWDFKDRINTVDYCKGINEISYKLMQLMVLEIKTSINMFYSEKIQKA